ncbi:Vacuolar protein sorting-associated protein [Wickerhamomyces ciferrii]|uniref:Vacuolar protein sorting-associated protein n=1 Tax=Wickerhamomyces ciferrii (strain ATCC 14091 / BCRC 22168 / CBS 111 / JCM 3599 / NBRC 0793 / NRRL Y-1031 F-60-10) TaxID=1206466 RepID=K0KNR3_WICCF|nr:Vacuolar protein sorting-associated protein [Wickerhamomyces ciferrii]CCH43039.1 Vacuolar protein sorting-associated protein [Wickerhamomyces ciferrii]
MTLVEEINPRIDRDSYFTSSINLPSKSKHRPTSEDFRPRKRLAPGTYNLATIESNLHGTGLTEDLVETKNSLKRFEELDKENYNDTAKIELPKNGMNFEYTKFEANQLNSEHLKFGPKGGKLKQGSTTQIKKILASRKTLTNYLDEDDKTTSILFNLVSKKKNLQFLVPNKKLCSICGDNSPGSCVRCNSRVCSVKCSTVHNETRCSNYFG